MKRLEANTAEKNPGQKVQANSTLCVCADIWIFHPEEVKSRANGDSMRCDDDGWRRRGSGGSCSCCEFWKLWRKVCSLTGRGSLRGGYLPPPAHVMTCTTAVQCTAVHLRQCFRKGHCIALHWVVEPCLGKNALQTHRVHSVHTAGAENTIFWRVFTVHCSATVHCINCSALVLQYIRQWQYTVP